MADSATLSADALRRPWIDLSDVLLCPQCGGLCLHHGRVEVFERPREDAPEGLHVTVHGMQLAVTTDLTGNPSARRNGLRIVLWCEWCQAHPALTLAQHKGSTYLQWESDE
jgi:hypothetical protein